MEKLIFMKINEKLKKRNRKRKLDKNLDMK